MKANLGNQNKINSHNVISLNPSQSVSAQVPLGAIESSCGVSKMDGDLLSSNL